MAQISATVRRLPDGTTLHIKVYWTRRLRLRLWLGTQLIKLAARVMGCAVEVTDNGFYL